jgi:hypothetical protein
MKRRVALMAMLSLLVTSTVATAQIKSLPIQSKSVLKRTQEVPVVEIRSDVGPQSPQIQVMEDFKAAHPRARIAGAQFGTYVDPTGEEISATRIFGTTLATGTDPVDSAWNHIAELQDALGTDIGQLVPKVQENGTFLVGAATNAETGIPKLYALRFEQHYNGIPVFRSGVGFVVRNDPDNPLVMSNFDVKDLAGAELGEIAPGSAQITDAMKASVQDFFDSNRPIKEGVQPNEELQIAYNDEYLTVFAGLYNYPRQPELAMVFMAQRGSVQTLPDYQKYLVIASVESGKILHAENQIQNVNVNGNVSARVTVGIRAAECDPEELNDLPYAEATIIGGSTVFADVNGNFTIPNGGSTAVTVRSRLRGQFFEVRDQAASNQIPELQMSVTPPGPANFIHNPASASEFEVSNVNCYYHANICRDWVLDFEPSFPVIAGQTFFDINTNINDSCNAFYDGSSINFFRAGGGCNNTGFADVVYHEYGHHLVNVTGNGQSAFGEGSGDCVGVIIEDDSQLGRGFDGPCNTGIRNANNNLQYPCSGGGHFCGQLLSGCIWDTMKALQVTNPSSYQDISGELFLGMMILRGQLEPFNSDVEPSIAEMYLVVDDDDADIFNGTPHYNEINAGFSDHNMDPPQLDALTFVFPSGRSEFISPAGGVEFNVQVQPLTGTPQPGTGVVFIDSGSGFQSFAMNQVSSNVYEVAFPQSDCGTVMRYYFSAMDTGSNTQLNPRLAPAVVYTAISGILVDTPFDDNFESNNGWTTSGNATDGHWTRGIPVGGGDRGDPPTDGDGSSRCLLTDNVDGNSDVDSGSTITTSPIFNATTASGEEAIISYYRWYNNVAGDSPQADIFEVEISNNGGSSWTDLETVGPSGPEVQGGWIFKQFNIGNTITPTSQMRIRFIASDLGAGSVVEAGVDGVKVLVVGCDEMVSPSSFQMIEGVTIGGTVGDLAESDDVGLLFQSRFGGANEQQVIQLTVDANTGNSSPSAMSFTIESLTNDNLDIEQTVEMYNFDTDQYEEVGTDEITTTESVDTIQLNGDLSRFVETGTGKISARISYSKIPPQIIGVDSRRDLARRFEIDVDQMLWTITP